MITGFRHAGIVVTDIDRALGFYQDLLGFKVAKRMDESGDYLANMLALPGVKVTTIKMTAPDGGMIELLQFHTHPKVAQKNRQACDIGPTHVALTVKDLEETYRKLTKAGVSFNAPPQSSPDGHAKVTFCKDPDGSLVELVQVL